MESTTYKSRSFGYRFRMHRDTVCDALRADAELDPPLRKVADTVHGQRSIGQPVIRRIASGRIAAETAI